MTERDDRGERQGVILQGRWAGSGGFFIPQVLELNQLS